MGPEVGSKVIAVARGLIGSHYINGAYGATPGGYDGCPCRPGGINLIADPNRLDPTRAATANKNLAVLAAEMSIKKYCVCAGNYSSMSPRGGDAVADGDLLAYLASLKGRPPATWQKYKTHYTPRRAFGPGAGPGGDLNGKLVLGQSCAGIRHFDCVGFISYCYWKATGNVVQLDISAWRNPKMGGTVFNFKDEKDTKGEIIRRACKPPGLMDGDIIIKADHHIAFVTAQGTIYQAEDTDIGVTGSGHFSLVAPGGFTHLVRLGGSTVAPDPDWPLGWWKVWDGNTYYYFFGADGSVQSTKTQPHNTRTAPAHPSNTGRYSCNPPQIVITWKLVGGAPTQCRETFYNASTGCQQMNATSNLYSPLVATRMN
jgi:hypothetical protein